MCTDDSSKNYVVCSCFEKLLSLCCLCISVRYLSFIMMDGGLVAALAEVVGPISSEVEARIQGIFTSFTI